jgi:hypothetical protein
MWLALMLRRDDEVGIGSGHGKRLAELAPAAPLAPHAQPMLHLFANALVFPGLSRLLLACATISCPVLASAVIVIVE